ncbi:MAG: hypothetical protein RR107_01280 [Clostridia bacterium]
MAGIGGTMWASSPTVVGMLGFCVWSDPQRVSCSKIALLRKDLCGDKHGECVAARL